MQPYNMAPALETYGGGGGSYPAEAYTQEAASYYQGQYPQQVITTYPTSTNSYPQLDEYQGYPEPDYQRPSIVEVPKALPAAEGKTTLPRPMSVPGQSVIVLTGPHLNTGDQEWSNGIFGCFNNCGVCILAWFCPCYLIGKNAEYLGESFIIYAVSSFFLPLFVQFFVRLKIRERLSIRGSEVQDCCMTCILQPCALTQDHLELLEASQRGEVTGVTIQRQ